MSKHTKPPHEYTQEELDYAIANWNREKIVDIAEHLGLDAGNLRAKIYRLKLKGEEIPNGKELAVGTITYGTIKGRPVKYVKEKEGVRPRRTFLDTNRKPPRTKEKKQRPHFKTDRRIALVTKHEPLSNKEAYLSQRQEAMKKKRGEVRKTRVIELSECTPVYIPRHNTTIYVKPGNDPQEAKERYELQMHEKLNFII